jgi:hypothetical protein
MTGIATPNSTESTPPGINTHSLSIRPEKVHLPRRFTHTESYGCVASIPGIRKSAPPGRDGALLAAHTDGIVVDNSLAIRAARMRHRASRHVRYAPIAPESMRWGH